MAKRSALRNRPNLHRTFDLDQYSHSPQAGQDGAASRRAAIGKVFGAASRLAAIGKVSGAASRRAVRSLRWPDGGRLSADDAVAAVDLMNAAGDIGGLSAGEKGGEGADILD